MLRRPNGKRRATDALEQFDSVAKSLGLHPFLMLGTCLGMVRDGGFIEWDSDIDVGVISSFELKSLTDSDYQRLAKKLLEHGFKPTYWGHIVSGEAYQRTPNQHWWKNGFMVDVHFHFGSVARFLQRFDQVVYNSRTYNVPHPVGEYLEAWYGHDWRVPWDTRHPKK